MLDLRSDFTDSLLTTIIYALNFCCQNDEFDNIASLLNNLSDFLWDSTKALPMKIIELSYNCNYLTKILIYIVNAINGNRKEHHKIKNKESEICLKVSLIHFFALLAKRKELWKIFIENPLCTQKELQNILLLCRNFIYFIAETNKLKLIDFNDIQLFNVYLT
eukprot:UN32472